MLGRGRRVAWIIGFALVTCIAGCDDGASVEAVCTKFCRCGVTSPALQQTCIDECEADLAGVAIPDACLSCISLEQCDDIEQECDDVCQVAMPIMSYPTTERPHEESTYEQTD